MDCLSKAATKADPDNWFESDNLNAKQKKKLLGMALAMGVKIGMSRHAYSVGDKFYLQTESGPIGLEQTGAKSEFSGISGTKSI